LWNVFVEEVVDTQNGLSVVVGGSGLTFFDDGSPNVSQSPPARN